MWCVQGGKSLLVPTPRPRTGILSQIQLPEDCDEETLSKYSTRQVDNGTDLPVMHDSHAHIITTTTTVLRPLCRVTCVSWHPAVKNRKTLLEQRFTARMPLWQQAHLD